MMRSIVGMNQSKLLSEQDIVKYALKYKIDTTELYKLNDSKYLQFVEEYKNVSSNKYFQDYILTNPLIVIGFDDGGKNQFFMRSCNAGGFPNLKWNRYGYFNSSPLLMPESYLPDSTMGLNTFNTYSKFYLPLHTENSIQQNVCTETIVVYWNHIMGRQSKRLIETVQDYVINTKTNPCLYYVNTDNLYYLYSDQKENKE